MFHLHALLLSLSALPLLALNPSAKTLRMEEESETGATYKTQRVWFEGNIGKGSNIVSYTQNEEEVRVNMIEAPASPRTLYYADIPYELTSFSFLSPSEIEEENVTLPVKAISYGSLYHVNSDGNLSTTIAYGADATMLGYVVEAYLTYGKSLSNGCATTTLQNVYATWFAKKSATSEELKNAKILDYVGYAANGNSYEGLSKTAYFSVNEKWNTMCSQAGIDPSSGALRGYSNLLNASTLKMALILLGVALVVSIGVFGVMGFTLYAKRKGR